jgi:hypothetical protein
LGAAKGIACDIASSTTLAQLVTGYEGVVNVPIPQSSVNLTTLGSDVFARSGPGMGANWTNITTTGSWGGTQIASSGVVEALATSSSAQSFYSAASWPNDQWASVTILADTGVSVAGVILRQATSGVATAYRLYWRADNTTWYIDKYVNGSQINLSGTTSGTITFSSGDVLTGAIIGTNLYIYKNGFLLATCADGGTPIASGAAGIILYAAADVANAQISTWTGGGFQSAPDNGIQGALGVGGAGATVSWTGSSSGSITADGSGNYTTGEVLLPFGSYVITPSKTGYTFSPTSASETVNGADITGVSFTATQTPTGGGSGSYMQAFRGFVNKRGVN